LKTAELDFYRADSQSGISVRGIFYLTKNIYWYWLEKYFLYWFCKK